MKFRPPHDRVGDRVLFGKLSGSEVVVDSEELLIMKASDIVGVLEQDAQRANFA